MTQHEDHGAFCLRSSEGIRRTGHGVAAVYKGDVLFGRMKERYPGCRRYDLTQVRPSVARVSLPSLNSRFRNPLLTQDGDLASAKAMQNLWTRGAVRDGSSHHDPRWGVGGAERAEIFVRSSAEGHKGALASPSLQRSTLS